MLVSSSLNVFVVVFPVSLKEYICSDDGDSFVYSHGSRTGHESAGREGYGEITPTVDKAETKM